MGQGVMIEIVRAESDYMQTRRLHCQGRTPPLKLYVLIS